jgi:2,4-dienoyl-CoA reductase-like NADH-dependent reductase (Old Yellow Enzyme family)
MDDAIGTLLAPTDAGRLHLRNRVVMPAHTTNYAVGGLFSEQHIAYHRERAAGGVGLIVTEGMRVHPTSLGRATTVAAFDDRIVESLSRLVDAVHGEGAKIAAQILHVGRQAGGHNSLSAAWGASPIPWSGTAAIPHEMTIGEIREVVDGFGAAARRVQDAGVDAVEIHLGHGHLLQQFLSPASNKRTDEYGGDPKRRLRFAREAIEAVVATVGEQMPIMLRISGDEFVDDGLGIPEMIDVTGELLTDYRIDILHVSHSAYVASGSVATQIADMSFPPQPFRSVPRAFRKAFPDTPLLAVCRMDTLSAAAAFVADGDADLVALARAHIATPDLVRRAQLTLVGMPEPAHDCIACNQGCTGRLELGLPISCVVNPEAGLEREWRDLRDLSCAASVGNRRRRVLVIGGGPAGLNAAVAAAEAGHRVVLREGADELGGRLALAAHITSRRGFRTMIDQLERRARYHDVEIQLGRLVTARDLEGRWDAVIHATGATDSRREIDTRLDARPLADLVRDPISAERAVIVDEEGSWTALALAEHLLAAGAQVALLCAQPAFAWRVPVYSKPAHLERMRGPRFTVRLLTEAIGRDQDAVVCRDVISSEEWTLPDVDTVTVVRPPTPRPPIVADRVHVVGDAYAPRTALEAAFEGRRAGLIAGASSTAALTAAKMSLSNRL